MTDLGLIKFEGKATIVRRQMQRAQELNLPGTAQGQSLRNMAEIAAEEFQSAHNRLVNAMANSCGTTASGPYLDMLAESNFGLYRTMPISAETTAVDRNMKFYAETGSLSDFLPATDGRPYISTNTTITDGNGNDYKVSSDTYVSVGVADAYVGIEAIIPGSSRNVPPNVLTQHNLDQRIKCTNKYDVSNGQDMESDDNFRYRYMQAHLAQQGNNEAAINSAIAKVPGISQFFVTQNFNGPGTTEILLVPAGNRLSPGVKSQVEFMVRATQPTGVVTVREPNYIEFEVQARVTRQASRNDTSSFIRRNTVDIIMDYLGSVPIGGSINTGTMINTILSNLAQYGVSDVSFICFLLDQHAVKPGLIKLAKRDLLVPSPYVTDPVKVVVS